MDTNESLRAENSRLQSRLDEVEQALHALRAGEVDAVVVGSEQEQIYTLEKTEQPYRLLVEQIPQAAATLTVEGKILYCNRRFTDLVGQPLAALLNRPLSEFVKAASRPAIESLLQSSSDREVVVDVVLHRSDGVSVDVFLGITSLREGVLGECTLVTDQTERRHYQELRRTQEALRVASERLELAQRAGRVGTFEWNFRTGDVTWSATEEELHGLLPGSFSHRFDDWVRLVHPDDRERVIAAHEKAVAEGTGADLEFRVIHPDGDVRWLSSAGKVFPDADGRPARMVGINQDVTQRKRALQELQRANAQKDEFLATLAHELRNPLAPIRNAVQIFKMSGASDADRQWSVEIIDRQVRVMARLLEDLLDVSRISRTRLELRRERVELGPILHAALETSQPLIDERRHELEVELLDEPVVLNADSIRLVQVFSNILNNAAKYTEEGGRLRLSMALDSDEVAVHVQDNGIGIDPEVLPHVFEVFSQAKPGTSLLGGGLGIGLSLVQGIVGLHGGTVDVRSAGLGKGSQFTVRLPIAQDGDAPSFSSNEEPSRQLTPYRILIVDDNHDSADTLALLLAVPGNDVSTAYDGEQGVQLAAAIRPDFVLLDLDMPTLDGYEVCRRIREQPWGRRMFIVAVTGFGQAEDRLRTADVGFDLHLVKPVDPGGLQRLLASLSPGADGA